MNNDIQLYIFDYGGTLDSSGCHWGMMLWHAYEHNHVPVTEKAFREAYVYGERTLATHPIIGEHFTFHDTLTAKVRLQFDYLTDNECFTSTDFHVVDLRKAIVDELYNKVKEETSRSIGVLKQLKKNHKLVLVSNFYGNISTVLKEFGFDNLFEDIIESAVVGVRKPDPAIYKLALDRAKTEAGKAVVVGDSYDKDIVPAHSLGCNTVWIKGEGWTNDEPLAPVADKVITSLTELL